MFARSRISMWLCTLMWRVMGFSGTDTPGWCAMERTWAKWNATPQPTDDFACKEEAAARKTCH